jgi:hypothetical protein
VCIAQAKNWGRMRNLVSGAAFGLAIASVVAGRVEAQKLQPAPVVASPAASAVQTAAVNADYDVVLNKAVLEFDVGHWSEAKAFFLRAHSLRPSARTLRGLALTSYELRLYVAALTYLRQALASSERPLTQDMREHAQATITDCESFITYKALALEPKNATVRVDGEPPVFDAHGAVMLDPGEHEIRAQAAGFEPWARAVVANGGDQGVLDIKLTELKKREVPVPLAASVAAPAPPAANTATVAGSFWSSLSTPEIVGMGLAAGGVVGLGLCAGFSIAAVNENAASKRACMGNACEADRAAQHHSALSHADAATVTSIAGGALIVAGAVTYFTAPAAERTPTALHVQPAIARGVAAITLAGGF